MRRTEYYVQAFKRLEEHKYTFNWSAAIFGIGWMLYRKMYLYSFFCCAIGYLVCGFIAFVLGFINGHFDLNY